MIEALTEVWTIPGIVCAIVGGILAGLFVQAFHPRRERAMLTRIALLKTFVVLWLGVLFYAGQIIDAWVASDANASRVISRFAVWVIYAAASGVGVYLGHMRRSL